MTTARKGLNAVYGLRNTDYGFIMADEKNITRSAGRVASGTMISRLLGFVREMVAAYLLGAGVYADAFYAAFQIPNLFRRILGEGSMSASFIPVLSEYLHTKSKEETQELINVVNTVLILVLSVLTVLGMVFAPEIVNLMRHGFISDPEKFELTITLTRYLFPFLFFICLAALGMGILNTLNSFFIPSLAPASLSVAEIAFILGIAPLLSPESQIKGLAFSVIAGGVGHFLIQLPRIKKLGWFPKFSINFRHPGLRKIGLLMLPSIIGMSVDQINAFVDSIVASYLELGSITAIYYSNRVMQMPLAIFGLALSSVALPLMSKAAAQKDIAGMKETLNFSIRFIIFILVPCAAGLMVIGLPIIQVLFQRGNWDAHASALTNTALFYFSLGLPAYAIVKVLASAFYSLQERKAPVMIAVAAMVINAVLCVTLMGPLRVGGIALASAIASYFNAAALAIVLRKRIGLIGLKKILATVFKTLVGAAAMSVVSYAIAFAAFPGKPLIGMPLALAAGAAVYFAFAKLLDMSELKPLLSIIFREQPGSDD